MHRRGADETAAALTPRLEAIVSAAPGLAEKHASPVAPAIGGGDAVRFITPGGVRVLVVSDGERPAGLRARRPGPNAAMASGRRLTTPRRQSRRCWTPGRGPARAPAVADEARAIGGAIKGFAAPGSLGLRADFLPQIPRAGPRPGRGLRGASRLRRARGRRGRARLARARARRRAPVPPTESAQRCACSARRSGRTPRAAPKRTRRPRWAASRCSIATGAATRLSRLIVAVVGNVDPAAVAAALTSRLPRAATSAPRPSPPYRSCASSPLPAASASASPRPRAERARADHGVPRASGTESSAVVGYPTFAAGEPSRLPVEVLAEVLGGEGGRLAAAFADERTLAAGRTPACRAAAAPGYLAVTVTCPPARLDAAVAAVRAALARVAVGRRSRRTRSAAPPAA